MAFREVTVVQVKQVLRGWLRGEGERTAAKRAGVARMTARNYITAAVELGLDRCGGEGQLSDELVGQICERVRPRRPDGHGEAWRELSGEVCPRLDRAGPGYVEVHRWPFVWLAGLAPTRRRW